MDEFVYNAVNGYFHTLENFGYSRYRNIRSLLVLIFFYNLIYRDYRGFIKKKDYQTIERAMNCLYGSSCLIPYPDYLKMGKLKLGEMTEVLDRVKALETVKVVKGKKHIQDIADIDLTAYDEVGD